MEDKKVGQNTKKQVVARGVKRSVSFSNPFNVREVIFYTTPAQLVYETSFDDCADSLRSLSAVLPSVAKNTSEMMAVNGAVDHLTNSAVAEIRKEVARIKKIAEDTRPFAAAWNNMLAKATRLSRPATHCISQTAKATRLAPLCAV